MKRRQFWREIRAEAVFFLCVLSAFMIFRTTAYGMYHIPSESMLPTLAVGDRIAVNKFAYGYSRHSIPFSLAPDFATSSGRILASTPERGDVVVFKHPRTRQTFIKRVIALPGDEIALRKGRLYLNGVMVQRALKESYKYREHRGGLSDVSRFEETLPDSAAHAILERGDDFLSDDYGPAIIPENHLFVMGDNRDNSLDSRFDDPGIGILPMAFLVGRADYIVISANFSQREEGLKKHQGRWFSKLN